MLDREARRSYGGAWGDEVSVVSFDLPKRLDAQDVSDLDGLLRERAQLFVTLSPLIVVFNFLDWALYPDLALRWLGYRVTTMLALVFVVHPLTRRLSHGSAFAELIAFATGTSLCISVMLYESGGFRSDVYMIFVLLCWAFSVIAPLGVRRALVLGLAILVPYLVSGCLRGNATVSLVAVHFAILGGSLLFTLLGSHLATTLFLRQRRAERKTQELIGVLEEISRRDPLTGIWNRRALEERIRKELARLDREGIHFCLVLADLDHFKAVNDISGHPAGDLVLVRVGRAMESVIRSNDGVFRIGGEEFAVTLTHARLPEARVAAERVRRAIETLRIGFEGRMIQVTVSLGIAEAMVGEGDKSLMMRADGALYRAKQGGRNRVASDDAGFLEGLRRREVTDAGSTR